MPSRHLLNPEMTPLIEQFTDLGFDLANSPAIQATRRFGTTTPVVAGTEVSENFISDPERVPTKLLIFPGAPHGFAALERSAVAARLARGSSAELKSAIDTAGISSMIRS